jgi:hypothetical protein
MAEIEERINLSKISFQTQTDTTEWDIRIPSLNTIKTGIIFTIIGLIIYFQISNLRKQMSYRKMIFLSNLQYNDINLIFILNWIFEIIFITYFLNTYFIYKEKQNFLFLLLKELSKWKYF